MTRKRRREGRKERREENFIIVLSSGSVKHFSYLFSGTPGLHNFFHRLFSLSTWSLLNG
jgi:hypothetical protein